LEQNEPAFCLPQFTVHAANAVVSNATDRQNPSILSIAIDFALHSTKCKSLLHKDLQRSLANRREQNAKIPGRQINLSNGVRGSTDKMPRDFGP
jgi:hypothetical protein